jgi:hypothetical protein
MQTSTESTEGTLAAVTSDETVPGNGQVASVTSPGNGDWELVSPPRDAQPVAGNNKIIKEPAESTPQRHERVKQTIQTVKDKLVSPKGSGPQSPVVTVPRAVNAYRESVLSYYEEDFTGQVWAAGVYPELSWPQMTQKPEFGVALGDGGLRSACYNLGCLRALNKHGLLFKARYISTSAASAWVAEPLLWAATMNTSNGLKKATTTELDSVYRTVVEFASERVRKALATDFYNPVFDTETDSYLTAAKSLFAAVDAEGYPNYLEFGQDTFECSRLPFLILNSAILSAASDICKVAPFEFTPAYCGVPLDPRVVDASAFASYRGGFVHRTVFGRDYSCSQRSVMNGRAVTQRSDHSFRLSSVSSISGSAVARDDSNADCAVLEMLYSKPKPLNSTAAKFSVSDEYWSLNAASSELVGGRVKFCDAASVDNTGILSLLRRGVKTILATCPVSVDIETTDERALTEGLHNYMALFGCVTQEVEVLQDYETYNMQRKVFDSSSWKEMLTALQARRLEGKPLVYTFDRLVVRENKYCGVKEGVVDITFVFNGRCSKFGMVDIRSLEHTWCSVVSSCRKLPLLNKLSSKKVDSDYPFIAGDELNYSQDVVDALCSQCEWTLEECLPTLVKTLDWTGVNGL